MLVRVDAPSPPRSRLDVRVSGGVVRGTRAGGVLAWRGIPYAAPPVGERRFRAPQPVVPWPGIRDASRFGNVAPQAYKGQFRGASPKVPSGEDCLTINVLTAAVIPRKRLGMPVMVFIHGGGYTVGSSQDFTGQGEGFVRTGRVVCVSFNYRLGALGYLDFTRYSTPERPIESNLGLRDQVAALEWVRANIRGFGGDPNNVTLIGESAGGNAVITLMTTPAARGLFARGIAQSAPSNAAYSREVTAAWAAEFVEELRALKPGDDSRAAPGDLLTGADAGDLVRAGLVLQMRTPVRTPGTFCMAPVVDGDFLPERPLDAFRHGRAHRVPLIIGTNDREGSVFRGRLDILPKSPGRIQAIFEQAPASSHDAMRNAYPGLPLKRPASDFGGDYAFWYPSMLVGEHHSRVARVHVYRFDVAPRLMRVMGLDATHGIEMFALFDSLNGRYVRTMTALGGLAPYTSAGERMRRHWLRFACTGRVNDAWPAYSEIERLTLIIDTVDRVESDPRGDRRAGWREFMPEI